MMMGFGIMGALMMVLFWGALIVVAIVLIRILFPRTEEGGGSNPAKQTSAREALDQRYARGEITRETYEMMRKDISS
jgi:putative membrane protein